MIKVECELLNDLKRVTGKQNLLFELADAALAKPDGVVRDGVVRGLWRDAVVETDSAGRERINRVTYEVAVLEALREQLRCVDTAPIHHSVVIHRPRLAARPPQNLLTSTTSPGVAIVADCMSFRSRPDY